MPIPQNKQELLKALETTSLLLKQEFGAIPVSLARKKNMPGHAKGSLMSVCDLLAYLIGWGELVLKWDKLKENNATVDFPETGYKWNELGLLAQKFYSDHASKSFEELAVQYDKTLAALVALVNQKTNRQLYGAPWYERYTLGRMIQLNTSSPWQNARLRLRKWKKENAVK